MIPLGTNARLVPLDDEVEKEWHEGAGTLAIMHGVWGVRGLAISAALFAALTVFAVLLRLWLTVAILFSIVLLCLAAMIPAVRQRNGEVLPHPKTQTSGRKSRGP